MSLFLLITFRRVAVVKGHVHTGKRIQSIMYTESQTGSSKASWMGLNGDKLHGCPSCSCSSSLTPPRFCSTSSCLNHTEAWTALSCCCGGSPYTNSHSPPFCALVCIIFSSEQNGIFQSFATVDWPVSKALHALNPAAVRSFFFLSFISIKKRYFLLGGLPEMQLSLFFFFFLSYRTKFSSDGNVRFYREKYGHEDCVQGAIFSSGILTLTSQSTDCNMWHISQVISSVNS